jgi:hypothetical protein
MEREVLTITLLDDGSGGFKVDGTKLKGSEAEILGLYGDLAKATGGEFKVEKHVHKHPHVHGQGEHLHQH